MIKWRPSIFSAGPGVHPANRVTKAKEAAKATMREFFIGFLRLIVENIRRSGAGPLRLSRTDSSESPAYLHGGPESAGFNGYGIQQATRRGGMSVR